MKSWPRSAPAPTFYSDGPGERLPAPKDPSEVSQLLSGEPGI